MTCEGVLFTPAGEPAQVRQTLRHRDDTQVSRPICTSGTFHDVRLKEPLTFHNGFMFSATYLCISKYLWFFKQLSGGIYNFFAFSLGCLPNSGPNFANVAFGVFRLMCGFFYQLCETYITVIVWLLSFFFCLELSPVCIKFFPIISWILPILLPNFTAPIILENCKEFRVK